MIEKDVRACPFCGKTPPVINRKDREEVRCLTLGCPAHFTSSLEQWNARFDDLNHNQDLKVIAKHGDQEVVECRRCQFRAKRFEK